MRHYLSSQSQGSYSRWSDAMRRSHVTLAMVAERQGRDCEFGGPARYGEMFRSVAMHVSGAEVAEKGS